MRKIKLSQLSVRPSTGELLILKGELEAHLRYQENTGAEFDALAHAVAFVGKCTDPVHAVERALDSLVEAADDDDGTSYEELAAATAEYVEAEKVFRVAFAEADAAVEALRQHFTLRFQ